MERDDFLTLNEAAEALKVDRTTLVRWVDKGTIPRNCYQRPERVWRFSRIALERWLRSGDEGLSVAPTESASSSSPASKIPTKAPKAEAPRKTREKPKQKKQRRSKAEMQGLPPLEDMRAWFASQKQGNSHTAEAKRKAIALLREGYSAYEIEEASGVKSRTVYNWEKEGV